MKSVRSQAPGEINRQFLEWARTEAKTQSTLESESGGCLVLNPLTYLEWARSSEAVTFFEPTVNPVFLEVGFMGEYLNAQILATPSLEPGTIYSFKSREEMGSAQLLCKIGGRWVEGGLYLDLNVQLGLFISRGDGFRIRACPYPTGSGGLSV